LPSDPRATLRAWITERSDNVPDGGIADDTALFDARVLTSLHIPELLMLLEELSERPIDIEALQPGDFHDIDTIVRRFIDGAVAGERTP
jgi:hypothetical protein